MAQTMACAHCGEINPAEARFCIGCGESLALQAATGPTTKLQGSMCSTCGAPNPTNAQFCATCGRATGQPPQPQVVPPRVVSPQQHYPPPQARVYPRVNTPPVYVPRQTRPTPQQGGVYAPMIMLTTLFVVVFGAFAARSGWPLFFLFLPLGLFGNMFRGRGSIRNYAPVFWMVGLLFLIVTKTFWPGILFLWLIWAIFGR